MNRGGNTDFPTGKWANRDRNTDFWGQKLTDLSPMMTSTRRRNISSLRCLRSNVKAKTSRG